MAEKSKLAQKWSSLTGITYSIDPLIAQAGSDEQKVKLYAELVWCIYRGRVTNNQWVAENAIDCTTGLSVLLLKDITTEGWEPSEDFLTEEEIAILKKWIEEGTPVKLSDKGGLELDDEGAVKVKCGQGIDIDTNGALICKCGGGGSLQYFAGDGINIDSNSYINVQIGKGLSLDDTNIMNVELGEGLDFDGNAIKCTYQGKIYTAGSYITISDDNVISAEDMRYDDANVLSYISDINTSITEIDKLIPSDAREDNKLADKAYVDTKAISNLVETTYKDLAQNATMGKLAPGTWYRITDYQCTTITDGTTSAGHQFDIIVLADSTTQLNCKAHAALHEGDTYFASCDLSKWELWYDINNDTAKYAWADSTNGTGIIYRMIDEFKNDCPYDFKNIQFYRSYDETTKLFSTINSDETGVACYTFSNDLEKSSTESVDYSLNNINGIIIKGNQIKSRFNYIIETGDVVKIKYDLNNICFFGYNCYYNTFGYNCYSNTIGNVCYEIVFGDGCFSNIIGNTCYLITFKDECYSNTINYECHDIIFGNKCYSNTIGYKCEKIQFDDSCVSNTMGNASKEIVFGQSCASNTFGGECSSITFGNYCGGNEFYSTSGSIVLQNFCYRIKTVYPSSSLVVGNNCSDITFYKQCYRINIYDNCLHISIGNNTTVDSIKTYQYIIFYANCNYVQLYVNNDIIHSSSAVCNYVNVSSNICGTSSDIKKIILNSYDQDYQTTIVAENDITMTV